MNVAETQAIQLNSINPIEFGKKNTSKSAFLK